MVQWSPDTTPADRNGRGGYDYRDTHIKGFSLTHLSGAGCSLYGDFPFLPTTEPLDASPAGPRLVARRRVPARLLPRATRAAGPGYYSVRLNPVARRRHRRRADARRPAPGWPASPSPATRTPAS